VREQQKSVTRVKNSQENKQMATKRQTSQPAAGDSVTVVKEYRAARLAVLKAQERREVADASLHALVQGWLDATGLSINDLADVLHFDRPVF
jgi:hypothetical protein